MGYLKVCCLVFKCLDIFLSIFFFIDFLFHCNEFRGLYNFSSFKSVEVCFLPQDMISLGECSMCAWRKYVLCCSQLNVLCMSVRPLVNCVVWYYILGALLLVLSISESGVEISDFNYGFVLGSISFCFMYLRLGCLVYTCWALFSSLVNWLFYHYLMSLFVSSDVFVLTIVSLNLIWHLRCFLKLFAWYNIFCPSIFSQLTPFFWSEFLLEVKGSDHFFLSLFDFCLILGILICVFRPFIFKVKWKWKSFSHVRLFATTWTIQSMEFSRPEYWSG